MSTSADKYSPEARKLIRRHVMLGKNQGKTWPPRRLEARKSADKSSSDEIPDRQPSGSLITLSHSISVIPPKIGSDLSTVRFADAVEPCVVEVVFRCNPIPFSFSTLSLPSMRSTSAVYNTYRMHHHNSLCYRQTGLIPPRGLYSLREKGRDMDKASGL